MFGAVYKQGNQVALCPFDLRCLQFLKHFSKPWPKEVKRAAVELKKANVPLATIRKQLKLSERTLPRVLTQKKQNPGGPILDRKKSPGSGEHAQEAPGCD